MLEINPVRTKDHAQAVHDLAWEFVGWLKARYPEMDAEIDDYLKQQKFEEQISDVLTFFTPPNGECLLAYVNEAPAGILMLKDRGGGACEMNRMFVRESARGLGAGRALVDALKTRAREMGFDTMKLSALHRHHEALALYRSMGFRPDEHLSRSAAADTVVFMTLELDRNPDTGPAS